MLIVYAALCVLGTLLPLAAFLPWVGEHGLDMALLVQQALATPVSAFAWADVVVTGLAVCALVLAEGRRLGMPRAGWALLGLAVGPSLALPLFMLMRERHLAATRAPRAIPPGPMPRSS